MPYGRLLGAPRSARSAIYAHFDSPEHILVAVIEDSFADLANTLSDALERCEDPITRLMAVCRAYLDFAAARPHHYQVLFERHKAAVTPDAETQDSFQTVQSMLSTKAFDFFVEAITGCIHDGNSRAIEPISAATRVWVALHGQATLAASMSWLPWPQRDVLTTDLVRRLADLT